MDLKKTPTCRRHVGMTMVFALATIAVTLTGSAVAPLAADSVAAAAPVPSAAIPASSSKQADSRPEPVFMSIFTPRLTLPAAVKAPSGNEAGAFAALNALIDRETLFRRRHHRDAGIPRQGTGGRLRGSQLWSVRQANASAEYALGASRLVASFPASSSECGPSLPRRQNERDTHAGTVRHPESGAPARPAVFICLLAPAGCDGVPAFHGARGCFAEGRHPRYEPYPASIDASDPEDLGTAGRAGGQLGHRPRGRVAAALKSYGDNILQPVAPSALGGAAGGLEPATRFFASGEEGHSSLGESLGEALHVATDAFEAAADGAKFAEEAETAEALEPAAEGLGYAFAAVAFNEANAAFRRRAAPGEGGGGSSESSSSAASYGEPHEQTFSGASYAFQAVGEFTLAKSTTDDLDIQVREQRFPGAADVSLDTATAMKSAATSSSWPRSVPAAWTSGSTAKRWPTATVPWPAAGRSRWNRLSLPRSSGLMGRRYRCSPAAPSPSLIR